MNTEDNHPLRFDDIPEVLGWIKRKLVELDAKIDVIQGKKKLAVEEDRWFSVQEVSDYLPEPPSGTNPIYVDKCKAHPIPQRWQAITLFEVRD